jgi:hypothetical protein
LRQSWPLEFEMKITIRVETTTDWDETDTFEICQLERPYRQLGPEKVGLSLAEGKDLLHRLQQIVVAAQAEEVCMLRRFCTRCHRYLELKDRRIRKVDTVFGTVPFRSARIVCCPCETPLQMEYPYSPMTEFVPERATAELLSLEAKLSAQMPYRQVATMMREFLPVRETLNHVTVRNRALRAGARIEAVQPAARRAPKEETEWTLTIDGGFVRGRRKSECSSFEVLTGRLSARDQTSRVFAFVRNRLPDIVDRLTTLVKATVNQVLNQRMCKRQQMRWSPNGAHLLAQVRCAVVNGDLVERLARYEPPREPLSLEVAEFMKQFELASELQPQGF